MIKARLFVEINTVVYISISCLQMSNQIKLFCFFVVSNKNLFFKKKKKKKKGIFIDEIFLDVI
jgi:hypothetical protein